MHRNLTSTTLIDILQVRAAQQPYQRAYTFLGHDEAESVHITYQALNQRVQAIGALLQQVSKPGERALILYPPGLDYITAFLGCLAAGVIAVPAYPPRPNRADPRLQVIAKDAQASLALTNDEILRNVQARFAVMPELAALRWQSTDALDLTAAGSWRESAINAETLAYLQYTSGSTGTPKGVMVSHANYLHNLAFIAKRTAIRPEHKGMLWMPPYHDLGLIGGVFQSIYSGISIVLMPPLTFLQRPLRWLQVISGLANVISGGPNFAYELCVERTTPEERATLDLRGWEVAFCGAEPIRADTLARFTAAFAPCGFRTQAFLPCYGLAESALLVTCIDKAALPVVQPVNATALAENRFVPAAASNPAVRSLVGCGSPQADSTVLIVDPTTRTRLPDGQVGEIWVASPSVAQGYWGQPAATAQTFQAYLADTNEGPFLRTGDLGVLYQHELFIAGRLKDVIIIRGRNYYPQDIEATVQQCHPALQSDGCAAFAVGQEDEEQLVIVAEIKRTQLRHLTTDEVLHTIRRAVADEHQVQVSAIQLLKPMQLPKTSSGKVQRHLCRTKFLDQSFEIIGEWCLPTSESLVDAAMPTAVHIHNELYRAPTAHLPVAETPPPTDPLGERERSRRRADDRIGWLRSYANERLNSQLIDERRTIPPYVVLDFGNRGLLGLQAPTTYGGLGLTHGDTLRIIEQLGAMDQTLALFVGLHNCLGLRPILNYATPQVRDELAPLLATGRELAAFALTEPGAGSNPYAITTYAAPDGIGGWRLSGEKYWSGSAAWAGVLNVFAQQLDANGKSVGISGFVVRQGTPGLRQGPEALTMGMRGMVQNTVYLADAPVGCAQLLGEAGRGMVVAQDAMMNGRLGLAAMSLGGMKRCAQLMLRYAERRTVATGQLLQHPVTLTRLSELSAAIAAVESLIKCVAGLLDAGVVIPSEIYAVCKITGPEFFWSAADHLLQLLGGRGYIESNLAPQLLRDARVLRIFEGPTETLNHFLGARALHHPHDLHDFLHHKLGAPDLATTWREAIGAIQQRLGQATPATVAPATASQWAYALCGEVTTWAVLNAALHWAQQFAATPALQRATAWAHAHFEAKLAHAVAHPFEPWLLANATALQEEVNAYRAEISDLEQTLPGANDELDPLLRRAAHEPRRGPPQPPEPMPRSVQPLDVQRTPEHPTVLTPPASADLVGNAPLTGATGAAAIITYVQQWVAKTLGLPSTQIDPQQPLMGLGLDSLLAMELGNQVQRDWQVEVPLAYLMEEATVADLAAFVDQQRTQQVETAGPALAQFALPEVIAAPEQRHEPFPLTDIQHAYWVGRQAGLALGNVSTHLYLELEGRDLDLDRLNWAWQQLIERHDMLRAIVRSDGQQQVLAHVPQYDIVRLDLRGCAEAVVATQLAAIRDELSHQVLPAERWPLFEIRATRLGEQQWRLHLSLDCLILDARSIYLLFGEWQALYHAPQATLPALALTFRDYVLTQQRLEQSPLYLRDLAYWDERLERLPPAPELPLARNPQTLFQPRFVRRSAQLDAHQWQQLKQRARLAGLTPSVLLLAVYAEVLTAWSKTAQFTLNLTLFNRLPLHPQVDMVVGDFTPLLLLAVENTALHEPFLTRARRLQQQLQQDMDHRYVNGVRVLRELSRRRGGAAVQMPIVFTSMLSEAQRELPMAGLGELVYSISQTPQVWLDHQVREEAGALVYSWDAVEELFPSGLLASMFAAYQALLQQLIADEAAWTTPIGPLLPAEQLAQRRVINDTAGPLTAELLHTRFLQQAVIRAQAPAVITPHRTLTYGEVYAQANTLAHWLRTHGATPNTLVAVVMEKGWEQVVAVLGILMAGAAYLPVDPDLPGERQHYLLAEGKVTLALTQSSLLGRLTWPATCQPLPVDTHPVDATLPALPVVQEPGDLAYVIYTSGSTGRPKGVVIDHRGAVNTILDLNQRFGVTAQDRVLGLSALNFDLSVYDIFGLLAVGGALVLPSAELRTDPAHWLELLLRYGVTLWNSVPALMQMLVDYLEPEQDLVATSAVHLSALQLIMLSGDWIPVTLPARIKRLCPTAKLYSLGGATEASIWSISYPIETVDPAWPSIPYGKPLRNQTFHVLDANLNPRPIWVPGDLYIGGIGLAQGYWQDTEKTEAKFIRHPRSGERLYKTGDIGRYLPDGNLEFLGREDFQVKIHGHRIELGEIESALLQHPTVSAAVVSAVGDPKGNRQLVAYVVTNPNQPLRTEQIFPGDSFGDTQAQLPDGFLTDPLARLTFKLGQPGLRTFLGEGQTETPDRPDIQLPNAAFREGEQAAWLARQSYRYFAEEQIPLQAFSDFLRCLLQMPVPDAPLPKYRYPSAGNLYPVQTYLYIKPGRIEGLPAGFYYHQPATHQLIPLSSEDGFIKTLYIGPNQPIFDQAAFSLFLVGAMKAITPMYGEWARDFALLEAGYMSQLLMTEVTRYQLGLCPLGGLVDSAPLQKALILDDSQQILHTLLGGRLHPLQHTQWLQNPIRETTPRQQSALPLSLELQRHLEGKLPAYMIPTTYVALGALPVTANGKIDRKALPLPDLSHSTMPVAPPTSAIEKVLSGIVLEMTEIAEVETINIDQNFVELGLNSVHMVRFNNRLKERLNRQVPIAVLFQHPTIRSLARYLEEDDSQVDTLEAEKQVAKTSGEQRASARLANRQRQRR